jgi:hypothetical protein
MGGRRALRDPSDIGHIGVIGHERELLLRDEAARLVEQVYEVLADDVVVSFTLELEPVVMPVAAPVHDVVAVPRADGLAQTLPGDAVAEDIQLDVAVGQNLGGKQPEQLLAFESHGQGPRARCLGKDRQDAERFARCQLLRRLGDLGRTGIGIGGDRPHHDVGQPRAIGHAGDFPGHPGKRGGEDVFLGGGQAHNQDMPPVARQLPHNGGTEDVFTQEVAEPLKQKLSRGRFSLSIKDHGVLVELDVAPRVEDRLQEGRTVLGKDDFMGGQVLARGGVGELEASDFLVGIGVDGERVVRHA